MPTEWRKVPEDLADLLADCLQESPKERLRTFDKVLDRLAKMESPGASAAKPPQEEIVELKAEEDSVIAAYPVGQLAVPVQPVPPPTVLPVVRPASDPRRIQQMVRAEVHRHLEGDRQDREPPPRPPKRGRLPRILSALLGALVGGGIMAGVFQWVQPPPAEIKMATMSLIAGGGALFGLIAGAIVRGWGWLFVLACAAVGFGISMEISKDLKRQYDKYADRSGNWVYRDVLDPGGFYKINPAYDPAQQLIYNQKNYWAACAIGAWLGLLVGWVIAIPLKLLVAFIRATGGYH